MQTPLEEKVSELQLVKL